MKRSIKIIVGFLLFLSLIAGLSYYYVSTTITPYERIIFRKKIVDYEFIEDGQALVMKWEYENPLEHTIAEKYNKVMPQGPTVGKSKIVHQARKLKSVNFNRHNVPEDQEYWELRAYDIKNQKLTYKDYDVFELARKTDSRYVPIGVDDRIHMYKGEEWLALHFLSSEDNFKESIYKALDLESGEVVDIPKASDINFDNDFYYPYYMPVLQDKFSFDFRSVIPFYSSLIDSDSPIHQKYPKAYELLNGEHGRMAILTDTTKIETVAPLLQL